MPCSHAGSCQYCWYCWCSSCWVKKVRCMVSDAYEQACDCALSHGGRVQGAGRKGSGVQGSQAAQREQRSEGR